MKQTISILGCGWLGLPLAKNLVKSGYKVNGANTNSKNFAVLKKYGAFPFVYNINKVSNNNSFLNADVLIIAITNKNIESFKQLIQQIEQAPVKHVLFISSTSVYPNNNQTVTETTPTKQTPLTEIEELLSNNTQFNSTIIRFGGLFGYNRKPGNFVKPNKKIENPKGVVNLIHRDDCIAIIEQIIAQNCWNQTFNACADNHPTREEFYTKEVLKLSNKLPTINEQSKNEYKVVSNQKLKQVLQYEFKVNDLMNLPA